MKIKEAADCPTCPDCGEAFCEEHNEHYAECPCVGPDSEDEGEVSTNGDEMAQTQNLEAIINRSFLSRVPEIMQRGGFTIETAIEQAYQEEMVLIARLSNAAHSRSSFRDDPYREAINLMSDRVYQRLRGTESVRAN